MGSSRDRWEGAAGGQEDIAEQVTLSRELKEVRAETCWPPGVKCAEAWRVGDRAPPGRTPLHVLSGSENVYLWVTGQAPMLRAREAKRSKGGSPASGTP